MGAAFLPHEAPEGSKVAPEAGAYVFQHPLLQQFSLSLFQKLPVKKVKNNSPVNSLRVPYISSTPSSSSSTFQGNGALMSPRQCSLLILTGDDVRRPAARDHVAHHPQRAPVSRQRALRGGEPALHFHRVRSQRQRPRGVRGEHAQRQQRARALEGGAARRHGG
eukprot:765596-Prorocentrum_minimum.AAC.1